MYEYEYLIRHDDRCGWRWEFEGNCNNDFNDKGLVEVLNALGKSGWVLTIKDGRVYILMRQITSESC